MQVKHMKAIVPAGDSLNRITSICWSPNNMRMAAVSTNRTVLLFDENGDQKEKFPTKAQDGKVEREYKWICLILRIVEQKLHCSCDGLFP